jgi:hypothetical protein
MSNKLDIGLSKLDQINHNQPTKCLHKSCDQCGGSGVKKDGAKCIHYISCSCVKCTPRYQER